ncbi:hypothetical protein [Flavobacterium microcysteis]
MKTIKILAGVFLVICAISCSSDSSDSSDSPPDTRLVLPAILENNTQLIVPDARFVEGTCAKGTVPGTAENTIEITADGIIADPSKVSIEVDLSSTWSGEVVLELFTPSGDSVGLIKRLGTVDDDDCGISGVFTAGNKLTFNSANETRLASPYPTGNYKPSSGTSAFPTSVAMIPLATFLKDKSIKGAWKIKIYDYGTLAANLSITKLNSWKLKFDTGALQ